MSRWARPFPRTGRVLHASENKFNTLEGWRMTSPHRGDRSGKTAVCGWCPAMSLMRTSSRERLLRNNFNRRQPGFHQVRPPGYGKLRASQSERMSSLCVQMHFHGDSSFFQRSITYVGASQKELAGIEKVMGIGPRESVEAKLREKGNRWRGPTSFLISSTALSWRDSPPAPGVSSPDG
jgi:hypothetical protein